MGKFIAPICALLLVGCAGGQGGTLPRSAPFQAGKFETVVAGTSADRPVDDWWQLYDDPALDGLVRQALSANTDLRVARANLDRARAIVSEARALSLPSVGTSAGASYERPFGNGAPANPSAEWTGNGSIQADWELDLFGRIDRSVAAASADSDAVAAARDRVAISVAAETVRAYVDACALADNVDVARRSVGIAAQQLELVRQREAAGAASRLDVERFANLLENARGDLPQVEGRRRIRLFELAALLGLPPSGVPTAAANCTRTPKVLQAIPVGDGRSLLARRPDVREAEKRLAGETARVGIAVADLYPRISFGGSANFLRSGQISGSRGFGFSLGPLITWNLSGMVGGRARVAQSRASAEAALATFDGTVLAALKETEQALSAYAAESEREAALDNALVHAEQANALAQRRFQAGAIGLIDLLDAERSLLAARSAASASAQQVGSLRVDLFKVLGGNWPAAAETGRNAAAAGTGVGQK